MSLQHLITEPVEFNDWANRRYVDWLAPQSDTVLASEIPSSCPSIVVTLKHIWEAEEYWYGVVAEKDDFARVWEIDNPTRAMICEGLRTNSQKLAEFVGVRVLTKPDVSRRSR